MPSKRDKGYLSNIFFKKAFPDPIWYGMGFLSRGVIQGSSDKRLGVVKLNLFRLQAIGFMFNDITINLLTF